MRNIVSFTSKHGERERETSKEREKKRETEKYKVIFFSIFIFLYLSHRLFLVFPSRSRISYPKD